MTRVLGISGRDRQAAAALMIDGQVVAAAREDAFLALPGAGYAATGGFPLRATKAVLQTAALTLEHLDGIAMVRSDGTGASSERLRLTRTAPAGPDLEAISRALDGRRVALIDSAEAQARQALLAAPHDRALVIVLDDSDGPAAGAFRARGTGLDALGGGRGFREVTDVARSVARILGCRGVDPWCGLFELAARHDATAASGPRLDDVMTWTPGYGFRIDGERLIRLLMEREQRFPEPLSACASVHLPLQVDRAAIAHACVSRVGVLVRQMAEALAKPEEPVLFAGSFFDHTSSDPALSTVAPLPVGVGGAVGAAAALSGRTSDHVLTDLRLGPAYTEPEIKAAIERCRLDYVYEPAWPRLLERISAMLAAGKLIGWFQGRMEFGARALGGRSILADPSNPYARDNLGLLLRRSPGSGGFPVSIAGSAAAQALGTQVDAPFGGHRVTVSEPHSQWCAAALDAQSRLTVHTVGAETAPEFLHLLTLHAARTGVPGLINLPLWELDDSRACTPLDAVRTMFTTPLDALVCGRFLLMKDYWLLRQTVVDTTSETLAAPSAMATVSAR